jgi:hypothetical protein
MGGAIFSMGTLAITGSTLTGNTAQGGASAVTALGTSVGGGGIGQDAQGETGGGFGGTFPPSSGAFNGGNASGSTGGVGGGPGHLGGGGGGFAGGGAGDGGGGAGLGGALFAFRGAATLTNTTLVANSAQGGSTADTGTQGGSGFGGAVFSLDASLALPFSTLARNTVAAGTGATNGSADGGAVYALADGNDILTGTPVASSLTLDGSILADSTGGTSDLITNRINGSGTNSATATFASPSLVMAHAAQGGATELGGPASGADPLLAAALASNGAPDRPQTLALLPGSPALDAAGDTACATLAGGVDGRGFARPQGAHCDLGAFEARIDIAVTGGGIQTALVNTSFVTPLQVTVSAQDAGAVVSAVPVTFVVNPVGGASATLGAPNPAMTDAGGAASVTATANGTAGSYTVTASAPGATSVTFNLTNTPGPATTLAPSPTTPQSAPVATAFPLLSVTVTDAGGNAVSDGTAVTFTVVAASNGASATFSNSGNATTTSGLASITATANTVAGGPYTVTATSNGHTATFTLTNTPGPAASLAVTGYPSLTVAGVVHPFTVTALDIYGNVATGYTGTVRFTSSDTRATLPANYPFVAGNAGAHSFSAAFGSEGVQTITATDTANGTITGQQAGITVTAAPLVSIAVTPGPVAMKVGQQQTFTATGTYADSTTADITGQVTWASDRSAVVALDATTPNKAAAQSAGTAHISATQAGISGQATVTVTGPVFTGVQPAPAPASRPGGTAGGAAPVAAPPGR